MSNNESSGGRGRGRGRGSNNINKRKYDDFELLNYKLKDPRQVIPPKPRIISNLRAINDNNFPLFRNLDEYEEVIVTQLTNLQKMDEVTAIQIEITQIRSSILDIIQQKKDQELKLEKKCIFLKRFRPKPIDELPLDVLSFHLEEVFGRLSEIVAGEIMMKEYEAAEDREVALALAEKLGHQNVRRCSGKGKNKDEGESVISLFGREVYEKIMQLYNNDLCPICLEFLGKKEHCKNACKQCKVDCHIDCLTHWSKKKCIICRNELN